VVVATVATATRIVGAVMAVIKELEVAVEATKKDQLLITNQQNLISD